MTRTICVVDDDRQIVTLATKVAESDGHEVVGFIDPFEAKAYIEEHRIDLVILDLLMPEMDGYEMTKWLREFNPFVRVVNMTGFAPVNTLLACWRTGADCCVLKGKDFVPLLKEAIGRSLDAVEYWERSISTVRAAHRANPAEPVDSDGSDTP